MKTYFLQKHPVVVPTNDGKLIEEHFGRVSTRHRRFSIAHMVAPPGWQEPPQTPEFDEITIMISGRKQVTIAGKIVLLTAGETLWIPAHTTVQYANPFDEPAEYWSVCLPAFSPDQVHRDP